MSTTPNITDTAGLIVIVGGIFGTIGYSLAAFFKGRLKGEKDVDDAAKESNEILRNLIEDQKLEITKLRAVQETMQSKITDMQAQIAELNARRSFLEGLISESVNHYFETHPEMAVELAKTMVNTGINKLTVVKK